jgi:uncharacterized RDD family membrane protein YckC
MNWYYAVDQQRVGPVPDEQFASLIQQGQLTADTLVWNESMTEWKRLVEVRPDLLGSAGSGEEMEFCAVDGKAYPRRLMLQYQGKWISAGNRDLFFQRLREGVTSSTGGMVYGGFWRRFAAKFLDGIILWVISMLKTVLVVMAFYGHPNAFMPTMAPQENWPLYFGYVAVNLFTDVLLGVLFTWFFLSRYQATPGKMALDLKVVRADGSRLSNGRIIGRYFGEWVSSMIFFIGYIMAGLDEPEKRALHDRICDTRVIKTNK